MAKCSQCFQPVSIWRPGIITGFCPGCQSVPNSAIFEILANKLWVLWVLLLLCVVVAAYCTPILRGPDGSFTSEKWIGGDVRLRGRMARDLRASAQLEGKTVEQVHDVLGKPDIEASRGDFLRYKVDVGYRWPIGPCTYHLTVCFDKSYRVSRVEIEPAKDPPQ